MKEKLLLVVVLSLVVGATVISNIDSLSYSFKSNYFGISFTILIFIGLVGSYKHFRKDRNEGV